MQKMNLKKRHLFRHLTDINAKDPLWERVFADWTGLDFLYML